MTGPIFPVREAVIKADSSPAVNAQIAATRVERRGSAFDSAYAPMFANLLARFPESAHPFLDDLLAQPAPVLSQPEAETVCRTLMDMPDVGTWRKNASWPICSSRTTSGSSGR